MQILSIKSIKKLGIQKTLDFEVDHKDHNFYAEGIVVSNSHSVATSYLSALTVYLKYKYPVYFFTACLNNVKDLPNPIDEIKEIKKELYHFGIKLLPPHILKSGNLFTAENDSIRFPLSNIKGISEKSLAKLEKFKHSYSDKFQIFRAANEAKISISILCSLILAGCLDEFLTQTRTRTVLEACLWNLLTNREQNYALEHGLEYKFDLVELVKGLNTKITDEKGRFIIKESRMETLRRNFRPYHEIYKNNTKNDKLSSYFYEKKLLGFTYSTTLYELYKDVCKDLATFTEIEGGLNDEYYKTIGEVLEVRESESKKGNRYLRVNIENQDGNLACFLFNSNSKFGPKDRIAEHEEMNGERVKEGDIVIVNGKKKDNALFCDYISKQEYLIIDKISQVEKES